jgi:hypothetical protein
MQDAQMNECDKVKPNANLTCSYAAVLALFQPIPIELISAS